MMQTTAVKSSQKKATFEQFCKEKFTELKAKHPLKNDKEIFKLVNKQWQQTNVKTSNKKSSSSAKKVEKIQQSSMQDQASSRAKKKLDFQKPNAMKSENIRDQVKEESENLSEKNSPQSTPVKRIKRKPIRKNDESLDKKEFKKFSHFYNEKLKKEHPKWTRSQLTSIIKLLWRKKHSKINIKDFIQKKQRSLKKRSGRKYFYDLKRSQGESQEQAIMLWKILPKQTRNYFSCLGANKIPFQHSCSSPITFLQKKNQSSEPIKSSFSNGPLSFLSKAI